MDSNSQQNKQQQSKITRFYLGSRERYIKISSSFDSGNIRVVKQISEFQYRLECVQDGRYTGRPVNSKSWFYFSVTGFPENTTGKFFISKVQALSSIYYSKYNKCYRPVFRINQQRWQRLPHEAPLNMKENGQLECLIEYNFKKPEEIVEFAFCYPYQFEKLEKYLLNIAVEDPQIYYHKQILTYSQQQRPIHLLTISSNEDDEKQRQNEEIFQQNLFPQKRRPKRFKRPVVLITARVHPGQTPASYAMQGVIDFLLDKEDLRAHLLRKMFVFMIVPMINVDGVYHGHFRMDINGKNLNRFYINPSRENQPAIFGIKQLAKHLISENRLSFYFDFHAHNAKKGCFIYGNAFSDFVQQVESQVFCKLFAMNHSGFEYEYCNFTQKHMNAKDRFQDLTKQGCGRVVMHKAANIIHSYSLQCGIISTNHINEICEPSNKSFSVGNKLYHDDEQEVVDGEKQTEKLFDGSVLFTEASYKNIGRNLLISILDVFQKNPYGRVYNSKYKSMEMLRRVTAFQIFHSAERFRMFQRFIFGKVKNINSHIQQIMVTKTFYKQLFNNYFSEDPQLKDVEWPKAILGLTKASKLEIGKLRKLKSISETRLGANDFSQKKVQEEVGKMSCKQIPEKSQQIQREDTIQMVRTNSIQLAQMNLGQNSNQGPYSQQIINNYRQQQNIDILNGKSDDKSDMSEVQQVEINQQILMMCQDQKQENELLKKIMQNDFNQKDYEQIEQKFKYKNQNEERNQGEESQLEQQKIEKMSNISFSHTQSATQKYSNPQITRDYSTTKDNQYRLSKKLTAINTQQVYSRQRSKKFANINDDKIASHLNMGGQRSQFVEIKKMTAAEEFRRNIYDSIKQEIKESLRKEYERKKQKEKLQSKLIDSFRVKKNQKVKDTHNFNDPKQIKSKVRLPSLGANMYIITTSTRIINKN